MHEKEPLGGKGLNEFIVNRIVVEVPLVGPIDRAYLEGMLVFLPFLLVLVLLLFLQQEVDRLLPD